MGTGYGAFMTTEGVMTAHRAAFLYSFGRVPEGKFVCHQCDNRACCNPNHLFAGSPRDNVRDMWAKGRQQNYIACALAVRGSKNNNAKIDERTAAAIKSTSGAPYEIARRFGVSYTIAYNIKKGLTWKHIQPTADD